MTHKERQAIYRKKHPEKAKFFCKRANIKRNYGLSWDAYLALLESQNYKCVICKQEINIDIKHSVHVDHDHNTGRVRGILCSTCNLGLGNFKDNIEFLKSAIDYLNK